MNNRQPISIEHGWAEMEKGIAKLRNLLENVPEEQFTASQYMNLYTTIYNMCTQKPPHDYSEQLYNRYRDSFIRYIADKVLPSLQDHRDEFLLQELLTRWSNHKVMVRWLSRFFNYLDRYYITRHQKATLKDVGLKCFRDEVYQSLQERTRDAVLALIDKERDGETIDRALLKNVLAIFIEVGMGSMDNYQKDFEAFLLSVTAAFYQRKAAAWIQEDSCPDYMLKAEECLKAEEERVDGYLHIDSKPKLLEQVEREVLGNYETQLLEKENSGCAALLRDDKKEDLGRMYRLFSRIAGGLTPVAESFKKHVESEGSRLVKEVTEAAARAEREKKGAGKGGPKAEGGTYEQQYVTSVIELHDKYLQYVVNCFSNSSPFHKALKEAFESFCNKSVAGCTSAELMATFCNNLLKKGGTEKMSDDETELQLEKVVKLLAYISDKDLFSEFYRKKLGRRLLMDFSASDELERSILGRLKQQCGAQFTSKMEGMVNDLAMAREKTAAFVDWKTQNDRKLPFDLSVSVLTTGFWPTYKPVELNLPQEMIDGISMFKESYDNSSGPQGQANNARKLTWIYSMGSCTIKANFPKKVLEVVCQTFQAAVILLFESEDQLSFVELKERLNLADDDLMRTMHSLSCAKYKLLIKQPAGKTISKSDYFRFNADFTDKARRIKLAMPPADERKRVVEDVEKDRKHNIDAAIVRTMKARKVLGHQPLVVEVVQQLSKMFQPEMRLIKKQIESLIDREYLARGEGAKSNEYKYLA